MCIRDSTYTNECANVCTHTYAKTFLFALPLCLPGSVSRGSFIEEKCNGFLDLITEKGFF